MPQMAVPPELAEGELLQVQGRSMVTSDVGRQSFSVGTYDVSGVRNSVDRNRERTDNRAYATTTVERAESTEFDIVGAGVSLAGRCEEATTTTSQETIIRGLEDTSQVGGTTCTCGTARLTMPIGGGEAPGSIELDGSTYRVGVQFTNTQGFNTFDPTGYIVETSEGAPVAGLSFVHPGAMWLANVDLSDEARHALVCLLTGAMLRNG